MIISRKLYRQERKSSTKMELLICKFRWKQSFLKWLEPISAIYLEAGNRGEHFEAIAFTKRFILFLRSNLIKTYVWVVCRSVCTADCRAAHHVEDENLRTIIKLEKYLGSLELCIYI